MDENKWTKIRPSVGIWSHAEGRWFVIDMNGKVEWFDVAGSADHKALTNLGRYTDLIEEKLRALTL